MDLSAVSRCPQCPVVHNVCWFWHTNKYLIFPCYRFVRCVQLSTMSGVFDTLIWILMFPSYRFVHCVQLSVMSTVFDTLIVGLCCSLVIEHLVYLINFYIAHNKVSYSILWYGWIRVIFIVYDSTVGLPDFLS